MRNRTAALLLALLAIRLPAAAQVEIRPVAVIPSAPSAAALAAPTALGASVSFGAPAAPAFALSAAPALAAPAPAAALAPVPAFAPALAAAPALAPAAAPALATPRLAPVFAAAAGPERPSAPSAAASADVPTDAQLAALFDAARPGSPAVATLNRQGGFGAAAGQIIHQYTFINEHLLASVRSSPEVMFAPDGRQVLKSIEDLVAVADARDPAARSFLQALGRRQAADFVRQQALEAKIRASGFLNRRGDGAAERRHMPRNDLGTGDYWDMAAGMNAGGFILRELEPGTRYSFFDFSPYVVSYLNAVAAHKGADAAAIEADILKLKRPERPLAGLRTKNAVAYVPGFEKKLSEMADWVAPGGRLVIQNDPMAGQRRLIVEKHGALARRLIEEGWNFTFEFASSRTAEHGLDTLIFTRPKGGDLHRSPDETRELWGRYLAAVKYADAREGY